jgi:hypothetical protein
MAVALKDRPVLQFPQPPGVTMGQWDSGSGMVTDAFKPDQVPGASDPLSGGGHHALRRRHVGRNLRYPWRPRRGVAPGQWRGRQLDGRAVLTPPLPKQADAP